MEEHLSQIDNLKSSLNYQETSSMVFPIETESNQNELFYESNNSISGSSLFKSSNLINRGTDIRSYTEMKMRELSKQQL